MADCTHVLKLAVPKHRVMVRQGLQPGGLRQVEELHAELVRLQAVHHKERLAHARAEKHVERLVEDVYAALVEIRGTLFA